MSAQPAVGPRRLLASALAATVDWLVEPAEAGGGEERQDRSLEERPVVAVVGLSPRCGTTTVARALGTELALRDAAGACAVTGRVGGGGLPLGLPAAGRLARALAPLAQGRVRACGRLCLVDCADRAALAGATLYLAPLVIDVADAREAAGAAAMADTVMIVGTPAHEPSLSAVLAQSLARVGPEPVVVLNRGRGDEAWAGRQVQRLPESRMGAQLALAGREPRGELGRAVAELADLLEAGR